MVGSACERDSGAQNAKLLAAATPAIAGKSLRLGRIFRTPVERSHGPTARPPWPEPAQETSTTSDETAERAA